MIYKQPSKIAGHIRITFHLPADLWADKVTVVGDFNQWDHTANRLVRERDGSWKISVDLPIGHQYRFSYWVDGDLKPEFKADTFVVGSDNIQYSVLYTNELRIVDGNSARAGNDTF